MAEKPEKATLTELTAGGKATGKPVKVQFNPETLKVSYANQITQTNTTGDAGSGDKKPQPQFAGVAVDNGIGIGMAKLMNDRAKHVLPEHRHALLVAGPDPENAE